MNGLGDIPADFNLKLKGNRICILCVDEDIPISPPHLLSPGKTFSSVQKLQVFMEKELWLIGILNDIATTFNDSTAH